MPEPERGPGLYWSVRDSFFRYVAGLRDGRASVSGGASLTVSDPQVVVYPADSGQTTATVLAFRGDLRLAGHGGLLFVRLADPRIVLGGERAELSVADPLTEDGSGPRLRLVTLDLAPHDDGWSGSDVRLTPDGVGLFNHVYESGELFDALRITTR